MGEQQELFGAPAGSAPLAERMRPQSLDEVVGQDALVGQGGVIRSLVERGELPSMVLWGPPGCGKTTLARLLAAAAGAELVCFSAVLSGVKEARAVMAEAQQRLRLEGRRTMLFVDEIHRFNRAQQDAFLPYVEAGDIILVGATTENPSFELNRALLSRVKVYILESLDQESLVILLQRAVSDSRLAVDSSGFELEQGAIDLMAAIAGGDARQALNLLEMATQVARSERASAVDEDLVRRVAQRAHAVFDKGGDEHFNLISALHKAVRNSDVDAALYWLGRMLEGGADPRFVARRMLRMASEDIGMADPRALEQVAAAAVTVEHVGMPECELALAQAATYLALANKSNAIYLAYKRVKREVAQRPALPIPMAIRNAPTRLMREAGYGSGYRYAHDEQSGVSDLECLPEALVGHRFYEPTGRGWEGRIRERLDEIAEARRHSRRERRQGSEQESDR